MDESIDAIGAQFSLDNEQARMLVNTVLRLAKKAIGENAITEIERNLPMDWSLTMEKA